MVLGYAKGPESENFDANEFLEMPFNKKSVKTVMLQHVLSKKKRVLYNMLDSFQKRFFYTTFKP